VNGAALEAALAAAAFLGSMFFAGVEIGLVSCDRIRLRYLSERGSQSARVLLRLLAHPDRVVAAISLGANISSVLCSALVTSLAIRALGEEGAGFAMPIFIFLFMVLAEVLPKALFRVHADALMLPSAYALAASRWLLAPGARLLHGTSSLLSRLAPAGGADRSARLTREELAHFFERSGHAGSAGRRWFRAVLGISERTVDAVTVPLGDLPAAAGDVSAAEAAPRLRRAGGSFLVVTDPATGRPIGTASVHDLLDALAETPVGALARPAPNVPSGQLIEELLPEIQSGATPFAFVVAPDGDVVGTVTHEAIAFAIVGAIEEAPAAARAAPLR
jgi:CBS domain containing-hemolysin-like protein